MKRLLLLSTGAICAANLSAVPEVSNVTVAQDANRRVSIVYSLSATPAVVTVDVQTNATDGTWISVTKEIGAANFTGDVWRRVDTHAGVIRWDPVASWPGVRLQGDAKLRAVVTAFATDDTPDYMVVDLAKSSDCRTNYYPSVELLPGGLLENPAYRTSKLVMRKVLAKDIPWTMGAVIEPGSFDNVKLSVSANKLAHPVQLTNNYYLAVFETTHAQWQSVKSALPSSDQGTVFEVDGEMRPVEQAYYDVVRGNRVWPGEPASGSFLGLLRTRTGIDFDLPSEAQWEFACRAGGAEGEWNEGTRYTSSWQWWTVNGTAAHRIYSADTPGRWAFNGGYVQDETSPTKYTIPKPSLCGLTNGTIAVGSVYSPNDWGFYDMHGNVNELCLDVYAADITGRNGAVQTADAINDSTQTVVRGGGWRDTHNFLLLTTTRDRVSNNKWQYQTGFRVACRAGLK